MSNIKTLKEDYDYRQMQMTPKLDEHENESVLRLIESNELLQRHIKRLERIHFIQGMNNTSNILFGDSIREL